VNIDAAYVAVNAPVVREQLQKAGVRLAPLLDAALGK
jgi:nuclease S1